MAKAVSLQRERRQQELLSADGDFFLPINQRADDPLDSSGLDIRTVDTAIAADNKGYQMLQRMGWGGKGLGRNENGMPRSSTRSLAGVTPRIVKIERPLAP